MTVHVLMPVFNRLELTKNIIHCLHSQIVDESINLVIVDDGSTDGTGNYLSQQDGITVLKGDGNLWWGGSIDLALRHAFKIANSNDWVMFVNNDIYFKQDFLQCLLDTARSKAPAAVGSIIRNEKLPHSLLSIGAKIDSWWLFSSDKLNEFNNKYNENNLPSLVEVDALSGRGVIFPLSALKTVRGMRSRWLPHYLADYELSLRVKSAGFHLLIDTSAAVYSKDEHGSAAYHASSLREKLFSVCSPSYLPATVLFWWRASNWLQLITLPFRLLIFMVFPWLRRMHK